MDKLSILELKLKNITDPKKLRNVNTEFNELNPLVQQLFKKHNPAINVLYQKLAEINGKLWIIEDEIRQSERDKDFGPKFVKLARDVYFTNDVRSDLKKEINVLTNSGVIEEKSYEDYS
jgi:hypothetical protein